MVTYDANTGRLATACSATTPCTGFSGFATLLDLGVRKDRRDRTLAFDLDEGGFHESYAMQDDTVAAATRTPGVINRLHGGLPSS
ncbi:hypothetical protein ACIO14_09610 [Nocardia fluminea]|uniref:hypothetical protein n=1 Tax=Nocardia fluminea TaxID=134984 RepID=UPI0038141829